jgi:hypothetical protein
MDSGFTLDINEEMAGKMAPAEAARLIKSLAIPHAKLAIEALVSITTNPRFHPAARVAAATQLLDRGFGKAEQPVPVVLPPGTGKTGVMMVPEIKGEDAWLSKAAAHHQKVLSK